MFHSRFSFLERSKYSFFLLFAFFDFHYEVHPDGKVNYMAGSLFFLSFLLSLDLVFDWD